MSTTLRLLTFATLVPLAACGLDAAEPEELSTEAQALVTDVSDSDDSVLFVAGMAAFPALSLAPGQMTLAAAVGAQAGAGAHLQPPGCLTTETVGNVVTYTFDACTGPWGLVELSGQEVATFSPGGAPGAVDVEMHSVGLTANGIAIDHQADVALSFQGGSRTIEWSGSYSGTTANGRAIEHTSELTFVRGEDECTNLDGTTHTSIGLRGLDVVYDGMSRCGPRGVCPVGTVIATGQKSQVTVTLTFDGTNQVVATGENGGQKTFTVACTPAD